MLYSPLNIIECCAFNTVTWHTLDFSHFLNTRWRHILPFPPNPPPSSHEALRLWRGFVVLLPWKPFMSRMLPHHMNLSSDQCKEESSLILQHSRSTESNFQCCEPHIMMAELKEISWEVALLDSIKIHRCCPYYFYLSNAK